MKNIKHNMIIVLHSTLWEIFSLGDGDISIPMMDNVRDKYVEPMEVFIYGLPYGASTST
jgi:hypothetical protein